ncbi:MAG: 3-dehydroquinate synthase [Lentimonas sp.]|jgi:3-dehydroquinate synthase
MKAESLLAPAFYGDLLDENFEKLLLEKYSQAKIMILVDENTNEYCLSHLILNNSLLSRAEVFEVPAGESSKSIEIANQLWEALSEYQFSRTDLIINLGGGMVCDLGGFVASLYKRGIDFINVPTSLLAMVDASIGGKTGIDLGALKNQIGVFSAARALFVDPVFLSTLPESEKKNGLGEMFKHALLKSKSDFELLLNKIEDEKYLELNFIQKSSQVKVDLVQEDPTEKGPRKLLNLGHTIGHALEGHFLTTKPIDHGHAVAIGLYLEALISNLTKRLSDDELSLISKILPLYPSIKLDKNGVTNCMDLLLHDKKNQYGEIRFVLLNGIGNAEADQVVDTKIVEEVLLTLVD